MRNVVSHMPMSPWVDPALGYYNQHNQASAFARVSDQPYILTSNLLGKKTAHETGLVEQLSYLDRAGITHGEAWIDAEPDNRRFTEALVHRGVDQGWIVHQKRMTFLCSCGSTEFLDTPENVHESQERTTYNVTEKGICCKLCNESAVLAERDVLVMLLPDTTVPYVDIYPEYAKLEMEYFLNFFRGKEYLISRSNNKPIGVHVDGKQYWIDVDMSWLPFIHNLQVNKGYRVDLLLTGNRTLKQTAMTLLVNTMFGAQLPSSIISTPRVNIDFGSKDILRADDFLMQNGGETTRLFLAQSMGIEGKNIILRSSGAYWIKKGFDQYPAEVKNRLAPSSLGSPKAFLNPGNINIIQALMKKLRGNKYEQITEYEKKLLFAFTFSE